MLHQSPKSFNLHTLSVWMPEIKNLMVHTHEVFNGERSPYIPANLFIYSDMGERMYTKEELLSSLAEGSMCRFRFHRQSQFSLALDGCVVGAYKATPTAWVLTVQGGLVRAGSDSRAEANITCFYETGDYGCTGRGFGLISLLPLAQLGC
jgi:hypothetical protein